LQPKNKIIDNQIRSYNYNYIRIWMCRTFWFFIWHPC